MASSSSSFLLSTSITGIKLSTATSPPPPTSVTFRRQPFSVSATYTTADRPTTIASQSSLYEVLGIQTGANYQEIKSAYRKLARTLHPDVVRFEKNSSAEEFIRVQSAYATLSDPEKRANYDRKLFGNNRIARPVDFSSSVGVRNHYTVRRKWETDQCW
ncbi:chaperone protein dnaJ 11, chloroplastic-like [Lycium ferocissimum]|uniref:chaperone protein dnaJ 11, chloroplastic-like n=1 Tax=Lycium ferocissimum TaxID=112874 RepID=UPI002814C384|nr:chaperone protein dnaJ 11, chloroplastic-like [Lycium ferocissimum]